MLSKLFVLPSCTPPSTPSTTGAPKTRTPPSASVLTSVRAWLRPFSLDTNRESVDLHLLLIHGLVSSLLCLKVNESVFRANVHLCQGTVFLELVSQHFISYSQLVEGFGIRLLRLEEDCRFALEVSAAEGFAFVRW